MKYKVMEIFDSIQGEGIFTGHAVTFVRFAGCNLSCPWCDTKESWNTRDTAEFTAKEIADKCTYNIVVLTGGEPCLQDLVPLVDELKSREMVVSMETNGTLPTPEGVWVTCSPKPPHYEIHPQCEYDELKIVVDKDLTVDKLLDIHSKSQVGVKTLLHPEGFNMQESAKRVYNLVMKYPQYFRMGCQMHKFFDIK